MTLVSEEPQPLATLKAVTETDLGVEEMPFQDILAMPTEGVSTMSGRAIFRIWALLRVSFGFNFRFRGSYHRCAAADQGAQGGTTRSGTARGGDADRTRFKRAISNMGTTPNIAGGGGGTTSGAAQGGTGARTGDGGNAYSGSTGSANGGDVDNGTVTFADDDGSDNGPGGPPGGPFPGNGPPPANPPPGGNPSGPPRE